MITAEQIHNELYDLGLKRLSDLKGLEKDVVIYSKWGVEAKDELFDKL